MSRCRAIAWPLASLLVACGSSPRPNPSPGAAAPAVVDVSLAAVGLEAETLDRRVDPCVDFYQFACGGWLARAELPPDASRWGRFAEVDARNRVVLRQILDDARAPDGDPATRSLGAFYASCLDEAAIERAGLTGVQPLLDLAGQITDRASLGRAIAAFHRHGILAGFGIFIDADRADARLHALYVDAGGLGLPDRDYYLSDELAPARTAYRRSLEQVFGLLGWSAAAARQGAADVLAIETALAHLTRSAVERRDDAAMYHPMTVAELQASSSGFDWSSYLTAIGNPGLDRVVVTTPAFTEGLDALMTSMRPAQWSAYLIAHLVLGTASALPRRFDDVQFELTRALTGVAERAPRWQRCVDATAAAMPEALGQAFVARRLPGDARPRARATFAALVAALDASLAGLGWMSDATKRAARHKLSQLRFLVGHPDRWPTTDVEVVADRYAANLLATNAVAVTRDAGRAGRAVDRDEWLMPAWKVSAYYNPSANQAALPAGILTPPFFGAERSIAANLGSLGMVVGHELTHGFDDTGAEYDAEGRLANWWQPADRAHFHAQTQCLAAQFSTFEALPGAFVNGALTNGENIADAGGVKLAFAAYRALRADATTVQRAEGFTEDQQFFIAMGQIWCMQDRPEETRRRLTNDPHAPPRLRVLGALRNFRAFAEAFQCAPGTPMNPPDICTVW